MFECFFAICKVYRTQSNKVRPAVIKLIILLCFYIFAFCTDTVLGVRLTASVHPPLTQDLYGKGMLGYAQGGVTLHQNALLPLLLVNPDFLKLYTENPSLASQYVTLLMHGNVRQ